MSWGGGVKADGDDGYAAYRAGWLEADAAVWSGCAMQGGGGERAGRIDAVLIDRIRTPRGAPSTRAMSAGDFEGW